MRVLGFLMALGPLAQQESAPFTRILFQFFPLLLIAAIFYWLIFRPMRQRQKNLEKLVSRLKNGDRVITSSGIYGTIAGVKDHTFLLKVADQCKIEVAKSAVASLQAPESNP